jgi:small subunit ribosomal protein S4
MGDPRRPKKRYSSPSHPWQKQRIDEEKPLLVEYGLVNKKEIWRITSILRRYKKIAKGSIVASSKAAEQERRDLLRTLKSYGLVHENPQLDDVLTLTSKDFFERRLQTLVFRKGMAHSMKQARQFITHGHITIAGSKVTVPGYLVTVIEEGQVGFLPASSLSSPEHPERQHGKETKE